MRRLCLLLAVFAATAACEIRDEPHRRASFSIEPGMTEKQAIAAAGAPSRTSKASELLCGEESGVRELLYDTTTVYFGGLKESLDGVVVVCLTRTELFLRSTTSSFDACVSLT